jgi:O-antigen/teichoic acid export membrane protein
MLKQILQHKVFKNFSYLTIGTVLAQVISLLTILKITHILVPSEYGVFSFLMVQGTLILTLGDFGVRNIVIRTIARDPKTTNDLIVNGTILRTIALVVLVVLYIAYNYFFGHLSVFQMALIFIYAFINCISNLFENAFLGNQKMLPSSLINLAYSIIWFGSIYVLPANKINVDSLFYIFLIVNAIKTLLFFICLKYQKLLVGKVENFWISSKKLVKESWPYFVLVLLMMPFSMLSNNFLDRNSTSEQIGYFNLSQKLIGPVSLLIDIGLAAIFPNLSSLWVKDKDQFAKYVSIGFKYFMLLALILCFLFTLFAGDVVRLLFTAKYIPAIKVSQLQIWYLFLTTVDSLMGTILGSVNKEKVILKFGIYKALFCTPFLFYGSMFGALGLSYGYVASLAFFQIYLWLGFKKAMNIPLKQIEILWFSSVVLFGVSYFVHQDNTFILRVIIALLVIGATFAYISKSYKLAMAK